MVREASGAEPTEPRPVRFEGPSVLEPGQNIYDQPPFNTAIWVSFQESGIPEVGLRRMLSRVADRLNNDFGKDVVPSDQEIVAKVTNILQVGRETFQTTYRNARQEAGITETGEWRPALEKLCRSLVRYPLWYSYSAESRSVSRYSPSGDKIREVNDAAAADLELPLGYGAWDGSCCTTTTTNSFIKCTSSI
jgi:hypothetical protein